MTPDQVDAFRAAFGLFFECVPDAKDPLWERLCHRVHGTAHAQKPPRDPTEFATELMQAFRGLGESWTKGMWSPTPKLFNDHFESCVRWAKGVRPSQPAPREPRQAAETKPASTRRAEDNPGVDERARVLEERERARSRQRAEREEQEARSA